MEGLHLCTYVVSTIHVTPYRVDLTLPIYILWYRAVRSVRFLFFSQLMSSLSRRACVAHPRACISVSFDRKNRVRKSCFPV